MNSGPGSSPPRAGRVEAGRRFVDQREQVEGQRGFHQDVQHAERGTAQTEGVDRRSAPGRSRRTGQGVELVGHRQRPADVAVGQRIAGETRAIVLLDGFRHHRTLFYNLKSVLSNL